MKGVSLNITRWRFFIGSFQRDLKLIFVFILMLTAFRAFLIFRFFPFFATDVGFHDILLALVSGLRFDARISAYAALPAVLFTIGGLFFPGTGGRNRPRRIVLTVFICISAVTFLANYLFVSEYKDNFNHWIFGLVYDDFGAVVKSMWKSTHLFIQAGIAGGMALIIIKTAAGFVDPPFVSEDVLDRRFKGPFKKSLAVFILVIPFVFAIRGSVGWRPVQMKDAGITRDAFLNKLVLNPYSALRYTLKDYLKLGSSIGIETYLPDRDIQSAAKLFFSTTRSLDTLDDYLKKSAAGHHNAAPPRHIFIIIMESLDSWSLLKEYDSFDLLPSIKAMGEKGILIKAFLPASTGTMTSFAAMVTGLPDVDIFTNYQPSTRSPFPTSMPDQFKELGYTTNLFYGGYLSWQHIGDFCTAQGFDHVYGGGEMGEWQNREWGVDDDVLFKFIENALNNDRPTVNVILTTSNHTPYDLPVYEEGFPYHAIPDDLKSVYNSDVPLKVFGHLWYSDKLLADFIGRIEKKLPGALFAVTGDHWSRKHIRTDPSLYERSSVPLLLYGNGITHQGSDDIVGGHLDIAPTLIEMAAPKGFVYYSMGHNLLGNVTHPMGFSRSCMITQSHIMDAKGGIQQLPFCPAPSEPPDMGGMIKIFNAYKGMGWWRIMKGSGFKSEPSQ